MATAVGPGELTSINFNSAAPTVTADFIENYNLTNEPDSYSNAEGRTIRRGPIRKRLTADLYDVSAINELHTLMTGRTEHSIVVTYRDGNTQTLDECILRVTPRLNNVTDTCKILYADEADPATASMTAFAKDLGVTLDAPTISYEFAFDGVDGKGLPYFSTVRTVLEFHVPLVTTTFGTAGTEDIVQNEDGAYALLLPDGNYQIFKNVKSFVHYADEDSSRPRAIRVVAEGVAQSWGDLITFTDGTASPTDEDFNAASPTLIQDYIHGVSVEAVGFGYVESDVTTF